MTATDELVDRVRDVRDQTSLHRMEAYVFVFIHEEGADVDTVANAFDKPPSEIRDIRDRVDDRIGDAVTLVDAAAGAGYFET